MGNMKLGTRHRNKDDAINQVQEPQLPSKKFIMTMPEQLHTEFKLLCVQKGISMKEVVLGQVTDWIKENQKP
ncbi:plasmid partition protein ParG [Xenorhabdus sp. TH1]|uniref:plasmid partition protein ParG n=1 Tax=Xenorhabdus sp. TH1 TaxID=3130166 RepID=UPI0030CC4121